MKNALDIFYWFAIVVCAVAVGGLMASVYLTIQGG